MSAIPQVQPIATRADTAACDRIVERVIDDLRAEIARRDAVIREYRATAGNYERFVHRLHMLLKAELFDNATDAVKAEYEAIHGPSLDDGRQWPQAENE